MVPSMVESTLIRSGEGEQIRRSTRYTENPTWYSSSDWECLALTSPQKIIRLAKADHGRLDLEMGYYTDG